MFGFIYDAGEGGSLTIVAHIPFVSTPPSTPADPSFRFLSLIVDRIELPGLAGTMTETAGLHTNHTLPTDTISNLRATAALLTLKRHALRLLDAWEGVKWPATMCNPGTEEIDARYASSGDAISVEEVPMTEEEQEQESADELEIKKNLVAEKISSWRESLR